MTTRFDRFLKYFVYFVLLVLVTGGTTFVKGKFKIEIASMDIWILILAILLFIRIKFMAHPEIITVKIEDLFSKITSPSLSKKIFLALLFSVAGLLFLAHVFKHWSLQTHGYDVTYLHQALFYPFKGKDLLLCNACMNQTYFGEHLSYSLMLIAPLTGLVKSDEFIFFIQVFLLFAPIYLLLTKGPLKEKKHLYFFALLIFISMRTLRNSAIWDFREDYMVFASLCMMLLGLYLKNWPVYFLAMILALTSKENVPFSIVFMVFPIFLDKDLELSKKHKWILSLLTLTLSFTWIYLSFAHLIPYYNRGHASEDTLSMRFSQFGSTPKEIVINMLTTPKIWWQLLTHNILTLERMKYIAIILLPFIYFLRFSLSWLIPAGVGIMLNVLPDYPNQRMMTFHYDLIILPFLFFALTMVLKKKNFTAKNWLIALFMALVVSGRWPMQKVQMYWPSFSKIRSAHFLNQIETTNTISASMKDLAHLNHLGDLRILITPEIGPDLNGEAIWQKFREFNHHPDPRSAQFPDEGIDYIFDRSNPDQLKISVEALNHDWKVIKEDGEQRFIWLRKPVVP